MAALSSAQLLRDLAALHVPNSSLQINISEEDFLGKGSFGWVRIASSSSSSSSSSACANRVAYKSLHLLASPAQLDVTMTPEQAEKQLCELLEECKILSELDHPNVVKLLGVAVEGEQAKGLVMELILPGSLERVMYQEEDLKRGILEAYDLHDSEWVDPMTGQFDISKPLPEQFIVEVLQGVYGGLHYLHTRHPFVIHGNLKPANILVELFGSEETDRRGRVKRAVIADLGAARIVHSHEAQMTSSYLSPEMKRDDLPRTPALDIFSMGIVAMELSMGRHPTPIEAVSELQQQRQTDLEAMMHPAIRQHIVEPSLKDTPSERPPASELLAVCTKLAQEIASQQACPANTVEAVVSLLQSTQHSSGKADVVLIRKCLYRLKRLLHNEKAQMQFISLGGIELLCGILWRHLFDCEMMFAGLQDLALLAGMAPTERQDPTRKAIAAARGIELTIEVLKLHPSLAHMQAAACKCIWLLARNNENQVLFGRKGAIEELVAVLVCRRYHPVLLTEACRALCNLAYSNEENQTRILRAGCIKAVIAAMASHPSNPNLQIYACMALTNLTYSDEKNRARIGGAGGIEAVMAAMTSHPSNPQLQTEACGILRNLAYNNEENKARIGGAGGIEAAIAAMTSYPSNQDLQTAACQMLHGLSLDNPENRRRIKRGGGFAAVAAAFAAFPTNAVIQNASRALSSARSLSAFVRGLFE